jgi:hypothetical protein
MKRPPLVKDNPLISICSISTLSLPTLDPAIDLRKIQLLLSKYLEEEGVKCPYLKDK